MPINVVCAINDRGAKIGYNFNGVFIPFGFPFELFLAFWRAGFFNAPVATTKRLAVVKPPEEEPEIIFGSLSYLTLFGDCPHCGSEFISRTIKDTDDGRKLLHQCDSCGRLLRRRDESIHLY